MILVSANASDAMSSLRSSPSVSSTVATLGREQGRGIPSLPTLQLQGHVAGEYRGDRAFAQAGTGLGVACSRLSGKARGSQLALAGAATANQATTIGS